MRLVEADAEDHHRVERLLRENGLPHVDLESSPVRLYLGHDDGRLVAVGGVERYGPDALLRSVVVPEERRGRGHGGALLHAIEARARQEGVERLYLLTTTAEGFFAGRGFEVIDRAEAPETIQETAEFDELCPSAATCMWKVVR